MGLIIKTKDDKKNFSLNHLDTDSLIYKVIPRLTLEIVKKYLRLEVEGSENLPEYGKALICPNHSGYSGFDAIMLANEIRKQSQRVPRVLTHHLWFLTKATAVPAHKLGFIEATTKNGLKYLDKDELVVLFPEGEYGNFKPSTKAYRLQEFKRGFIRMALQTGSPIIPTIVIGAEETHINLSRLRFSKYARGLILPLPLNILPLPAKWKIKFLPPISLPFKPSAANDRELVHELSQDVKEKMQKAINLELKNRSSIFL